MTIYFQGSELEALWPNPAVGPGGENGNVEAGGWSRAAVSAPGGGTGWIRADAGQEFSPFWGHVFAMASSGNAIITNNIPFLEVTDDAGLSAVKLQNSASESFQCQHWNGVTYTNFGETVNIPHEGATYDIRVKLGNGTTTDDLIEVYVNEVLVSTKSAVNMLKANFPDGFRYLRGYNLANTGISYSQWVIADVPTLDWNVKTIVANADGTDNSDGTGGFADINESPINNGTFVAMTTTGQHRSFKAAARSIVNEVKGFTVVARLRLGDDAAPTHIKPYIRIGGVRYYGTTFTLTLGYLDYQYTWNTNPATGVAWLPAAVNDANLEWGWEVA